MYQKNDTQEILLSICVVSYNHERYIEECMDRIMEQHMDFTHEIIVGNDCSTDGTAQVLTKYEDRAIIINRAENLGLCANLYDLFLRAKGKYVFSFAGDDYLCDSNALKKQVDFLETHPEYYAVSAWNYMYRESEHKTYGNETENFPKEFTMEDFLREGIVPSAHGVMRNTFSQDRQENAYLVRGARNNEEMKMWMYTLSKGKRYIIPEYLHVYRNVDIEGMSNYNSTHTMLDMFEDNYEDLCMLRDIFKGKYNLLPVFLKRCNFFSLRLNNGNRDLPAMLRKMKLKDIFMLLWYKAYLKFHNYNDPLRWKNRDYLIPGEKE